MANKLDSMCYTEYVEHLKSKSIEHEEISGIDIDFWMCCYVTVIPSRPTMKIRYFREDGGDQLKCD